MLKPTASANSSDTRARFSSARVSDSEVSHWSEGAIGPGHRRIVTPCQGERIDGTHRLAAAAPATERAAGAATLTGLAVPNGQRMHAAIDAARARFRQPEHQHIGIGQVDLGCGMPRSVDHLLGCLEHPVEARHPVGGAVARYAVLLERLDIAGQHDVDLATELQQRLQKQDVGTAGGRGESDLDPQLLQGPA